jgi:hypothetical protein
MIMTLFLLLVHHYRRTSDENYFALVVYCHALGYDSVPTCTLTHVEYLAVFPHDIDSIAGNGREVLWC